MGGPAHPFVDEDGVGSNLVCHNDRLEGVGLKTQVTLMIVLALSLIFLRWANPVNFLIYFCLYVLKMLETSRIQSRIIKEGGEDADHKTTTMPWQL